MTPAASGPRCEAITNTRGHKRRCGYTATFMSPDRSEPPRVVCVHHQRRAKHGSTPEPLDLATLPRCLLMAYLSRVDSYRSYCNLRITWYLEQEAQARFATERCRALLSATIERFDSFPGGNLETSL